MVGSGWQVIEAESFERGVAACGGHHVIEEIIAPIKWGLSRNPRGFRETNVSGVWIAKTKLRINGPDFLMAHSVWFRIHNDTRTVEMVWVEVTDPTQMAWDDDDELPF